MIILNKEIKFLDLNKKVENKLLNLDIKTIKDLWCLNRVDLKKLNFSDNEIKEIMIKLELNGLDLNKKIYN